MLFAYPRKHLETAVQNMAKQTAARKTRVRGRAWPARNTQTAEIRKEFTGKCCFSGNLDPIEVLMRGTSDEVAAEAERIVKLCYPAGGYIFCTGEMNPRDVPEENMRAMVRAARAASKGL